MRASLALVFAAGVILLAEGAARADGEADKGQARDLGNEAYAAANQGDWAKAETLFVRAESLYHASSLLLGLARARTHLGKYVEAWEDYHRIIVETLPPNASQVLRDAVDSARKEIVSVEGHRARVTVNVTGAPHPNVTLDGVAVNAAGLGTERPVNPGTHAVHVEAEGFLPADATFSVAAGEATVANVEVKPAPAPAPGQTPGSSSQVAPAPATGHEGAAPGATGGPWKTVGIVGMGVGGAGIVLGAIAGGIAIGKHGSITSSPCASAGCSQNDLSSYQSTVSSYNTLGTLSDVGFIAGGVLAAAGAVIFFTAHDGKEAATGKAWVTPYVGLGDTGFVGAF